MPRVFSARLRQPLGRHLKSNVSSSRLTAQCLAMPQDYDNHYKDLFSHADMVRDLLLEFVPGNWLEYVDFETLERVNPSYISDKGHVRHDDMVWRVRLGGKWLYVYVLLEFQSEADRWMALRLMVYVGLMYQDLVKGKQLSPDGKLPPVLPIVFYSGAGRWTAETDLGQLVLSAPEGLERLQPAQRYLLIDRNALNRGNPDASTHITAMLLRIEHSQSSEDIRRLIADFVGWLSEDDQLSLRRSLTRYIVSVLRRKMPGASIPELADLSEVDAMLEERYETWEEQWERRGLERGRVQGEMHLLHKLLERRFGQLPEWAETKLAQASEEDLMHWGEGMLDAPTIDQLLVR